MSPPDNITCFLVLNVPGVNGNEFGLRNFAESKATSDFDAETSILISPFISESLRSEFDLGIVDI